jgi:hypothetical protein
MALWRKAPGDPGEHGIGLDWPRSVTETGMTLAIKPLARRFAGPALAAWLLYLGVWLVIYAIEWQVISLLTQTVGWFVDHFPFSFGTVEKWYTPIQTFAQNMAEGAGLIVLGLLVGLWVVHRKKKIPRLA